jgi:hypothetical protein
MRERVLQIINFLSAVRCWIRTLRHRENDAGRTFAGGAQST